MDLISICIFILMVLFLVSGISSVFMYFHFQERNNRLPEACKYMDLQQKNDFLTAEISNLKQSIKELEGVLADAEEKKIWLEKNQEKILSLNEDRKKQEEIKAEYEKHLDQLAIVIQQIQDKNKDFSELDAKTSALNNQLQINQETLQNLLQSLETHTLENNQLEAEILAKKHENEKWNVENNIIQKKYQDLANHIEASEKRSHDLDVEFSKKQEDLCKEIHGLNLQIESLRLHKNELEKIYQKLQDEEKELLETNRDLDAKNIALQKENSEWMVNNDTAVRKLRELQDCISAEDDKRQNIQAEIQVLQTEYSEKMAELGTYQTRKEALLKEIDLLTASIKNMKQDISETSGEKTVEDTLKDLWEPIIFPSLPLPKKEKTELDLLADTKNYIRGKKLYFPDRVIHAFHTSMKCNDISPITILAGISGTGKSELPKCYAEGMGIHFSMLAVQPRWDSPQDLLGFYNYMENKYKATELARAMVRFDQFNRKSWGNIPEECDDRSDRMLLVLLDEMNLARVEYYFSEFLSKLETRRGVDVNNDQDRAKAEIELELTGRTPLRIFPGRNILFTGTMNEDESTQSLSDKVLDRANVLRFGKPRSADISEKLRNSIQVPVRDQGLSYATWKSWCIDSKDVKNDDQVTKWIDTLNDIMEEIQKPFGHRVAQAIAAYIANYPKGTAGGNEKNLAFADQIEQRIMPKLRGIDLEQFESPLKKISNLIQETNDEALCKAFEKGCSDVTNGVFMWQGIDRSEDA